MNAYVPEDPSSCPEGKSSSCKDILRNHSEQWQESIDERTISKCLSGKIFGGFKCLTSGDTLT